MKREIRNGWIMGKGLPLKIFAMSTVVPLKTVTAQELSEADVVICSYRLLFSYVYLNRREEINNVYHEQKVGAMSRKSKLAEYEDAMEEEDEDRAAELALKLAEYEDAMEEEEQQRGCQGELASLAALTKELKQGERRVAS